MRNRPLLFILSVLVAAKVFAAENVTADWSVSVGEPEHPRKYPSLCFYTVITKQANSYVLTEGYTAVRFEPKGARSACEGSDRAFVDLATRRIFAPKLPYGTTTENDARFRKKLESTKALALLEKAREDDARESAKLEREVYLLSFERAKELPAIYEFETHYRDTDTDGLIPKLSSLKTELEYRQYRSRYSEATTSDRLSAFIAQYGSNDPDSLLPEAQKRLPQLEKEEAAERRRSEQRNQAQQKQQALAKLEDGISWCNSQSTIARRAIDRERQIAAVSGYENKISLRQAGEIIVFCRERSARDFAEYRKQGGKKALADIE
jgi:hypothetical protein